MKIFKKMLCLLLALLFCFSLCACGTVQQPVQNLIKIPDIEKLDVDTAKTLLAGKGLIPKVEYEYNNDYDYDLVIRTEPAIGSEVDEDTPVTLYVCKGPSYYDLNAGRQVARIWNIDGIDGFVWEKEASDGVPTKWFYNLYAKEGYLYITVGLRCTSKYDLSFYGDFGTASINDTFDKTVPIEVLYDSSVINNKGEATEFELKIPLTDLGVQKPTNVHVELDFLVNGERKTFKASFDLTW